MTRVTQMIRIQLVREGRVVKQISSRVHESVVLEQINKFKEAYDEIVIVEGDLSEDAKGMLKHVARKIVPAAMAAGLAMGNAHADPKSNNYGNNGTPGLNKNFPALNYSPGQYLQQAVFNAQQRARGGDAAVSPQYQQRPQATKVYDQSRVSQDGRFFIIYDMDNKITRIPVNGTEFMAGDSQRMPHYITQNGQVMYVRHPHNNGLGESIVEGGVMAPADAKPAVKTNANPTSLNGKFAAVYNQLAPGIEKYRDSFKASQLYDALEDVAEKNGAMQEFKRMLNAARNSAHMEYDTNPGGFENWFWFLPFAKDVNEATETKREHDKGYADAQQGISKNPYNPGSPAHSAYEQGQEAHKRHFGEGMGTIGTTPTIPSSNTAPNPGNKPQFDKTGGTTNAKFNANGELELEDDEDGKLSPQSIDQLKAAGVKVAEGVEAGLQAILDQYPESYAEFKEGGDIDANQDFFDALFDYFSNMGEEDGGMPYGTQKARDGDPYNWIADKLDSLDHAPVVETEDDLEATAADQGAADKNIIMQIRKASDYEKPLAIELADGTSITITAQTANKILAQFDRLKPASKELMQQTLNSQEGFREMLNYFNEREVNEDSISIAEQAKIRARLLIKSVFGTI